MKVVLDYMPNEQAKAFVEEQRLSIENGVISVKFTYKPPLPDEQFTLPPAGISEDFRVTRVSGPSPTDHDTTRIIVFSVKFDKSTNSNKTSVSNFDYKLIMQDKGSYFFPEWHVVEFHPAGRKVRGRRPAAGL